jgi:hypothetical protein
MVGHLHIGDGHMGEMQTKFKKVIGSVIGHGAKRRKRLKNRDIPYKTNEEVNHEKEDLKLQK